jgi:hypothetical protein
LTIDHEKFIELENRKGKELFVVNKQLEEEVKKSRQNEAKNDLLRKKLDRKTEELSVMHKKLRDSSIPINLPKPNRNSSGGIDADISIDSELNQKSELLELQKSEIVLEIPELKPHENNFLEKSLEWLELSKKFITNEEFSKLVEDMVILYC